MKRLDRGGAISCLRPRNARTVDCRARARVVLTCFVVAMVSRKEVSVVVTEVC